MSGANRKRIFCVRHGETAWSITGQHTGSTDLPLTVRGRELARQLGAGLVPDRLERVFVSPLTRARETCRLAGCDEKAMVTADLVEWNYGFYEGLTPSEIETRDPAWMIFRDGCPGGESPEEVGVRVDRVIRLALDTPGDVAIFSHGHLLRTLGARWIGLPPTEGSRFQLATGTLCVLGFYHDVPAIRVWNARPEQ